MSAIDWVRHKWPLKLKDGKRHVFPTLASMVYLNDGKTTLTDENGNLRADKALDADKLGGKQPGEYLLVKDALQIDDSAPAANKTFSSEKIAAGLSELKANKVDKTGTAADSAKLGGKAPEYYLQPVNLINNSEFTIRGNGSLTDACWNWGREATLTIGKDGVKTFTSISGYNSIRQSIFTDGREVGKPYTLAMTLEDGTRLVHNDIAPAPDGKSQIVSCNIVINSSTEIFMITEPNGEYAVRLNAKSAGASIRFKDIDLFEGAYTADNIPPHTPKGYANELLACEVAEKGSIFAWKVVGTSAGSAVSVPKCDEVMLYVTATDKTTYAFNSVILPYWAFENSYIPMRIFIRGGHATITCANGNVTLTGVILDGVDVTKTSKVDVYAR